MRKPEWPGIATAVGIVLILALVIVGSRDDFHLKDWQTLIAGAFALFGGTLAYRGAMAKVRQDAEQHTRETLRRQLGLYLKLDIATRNFHDTAKTLEATIGFMNSGDTISVKEIDLREPAEISEAWDNLDVFPRRIIREIASIREHLQRLAVLLEGLPEDRDLIAGEKNCETRLDLIYVEVGAIADACAIIFDGLAADIERLAPVLPENERMLSLLWRTFPPLKY